jgi:hypothetical protein
MRRSGQFGHRVAVEGRAVDNIKVGNLRIEHGKAVVVFGRDHEVAHAGSLCLADPFIGIEFYGVEAVRNFEVFGTGDLFLAHQVFGVAIHFFAFPFTAR